MIRHDPVELRIIENLLQKEYPKFLKNSLPLSIHRINELIKLSQGAGTQNIKIESIKDNPCIRIKLPLSISLLVPSSTDMLSSKLMYHYDKFQPLAFLATYVTELNHFTMMRLYGDERIHEYFPDHNKENRIHNDVYDRFSFNTESVPEYSSLNFLLRQKAHSTVPTLSAETKAIAHCFKYAYWRIPSHDISGEYDSFHNLIYHSTGRLYEICDMFKTLVKIEKIYPTQHDLKFLNRYFKYRDVQAKILYDGTKYDCLQTNICVAEPLASNIQSGDMINAVIVNSHAFQPNNPKPKLILVNNVDSITKQPSVKDFKTLVSVIAHLHCKHAAKINFVETIPFVELASKLKTMLEIDDFFDPQWKSLLTDDTVNVSITALHPLLLKHDDTVDIVPPAIVNYLATHTKSISWEFLYEFISLIRNIPIDSSRTMYTLDRSTKNSIRLSSSYAKLQKLDLTNNALKTLFQDLPPLLNYVIYSRFLSRSFTRTV